MRKYKGLSSRQGPRSVSEELFGSWLMISICPTQPIFTNTETAMLSTVNWSQVQRTFVRYHFYNNTSMLPDGIHFCGGNTKKRHILVSRLLSDELPLP